MGCSEYQIKNVNGHYEVYLNGLFYCSADDISEAVSELENGMKRMEETNNG